MKTLRNKKTFIAAMIAIIAICICITAVVIGSIVRENELDRVQKEALEELLRKEGQYDPQSIMLKNTSERRAAQIAELVGGTLRITSNGEFATVTLPEGKTIYDVFSSEEARSRIPEMSMDTYVSPAELGEASDSLPTPTMPVYSVIDPDYDAQSYLGYMNVNKTWNNTKGKGVTIAVIDTGIDIDHPEFEGKINEYSYNASQDLIVKDHGISVVDDEGGHGTKVAGVISSAMNDGNGITGLAPDATLLVIKVELNAKGLFLGSDIVFGIYYAVERDVDVINMSLGSSSDFCAQAIQLAADSDIICVAGAGNDASASAFYPAAYDNVIGVGALADNGWFLSSYSNFGVNVDVVAPGTVYTTEIGGGYTTANGTSFASPLVAASVALYLSKNSYPPVEVPYMQEVLYASCLDLGDLGRDWYYGYGAVDVNALVVEPKGIITFEMLTDEVDNIERVYVKGHTLQNIPLDIERNYAVFDGWYYSQHCVEGDNLDLYRTVFYDDITLYANWTNEDDDVPFTYVILDDGSVEIRSYTGKRKYITIPDKIDGRIVSSIGHGAFKNNSGLRGITLPSGLVKIGEQAFSGCYGLLEIEIPDSVMSIEARAFAETPKMTSVRFGENSSLRSIGEEAFAGSGITSIEIPMSTEKLYGTSFFNTRSLQSIDVVAGNGQYASADGVLYNAAFDKIVAYPVGRTGEYQIPAHVKIIGDCAFAFAQITTVDLSNVEQIGNNAFMGSHLESVEIPDTVWIVGMAAFSGCEYMESASVGAEITEIPISMFELASSLSSVTLSDKITSIGSKAFYGCSALTYIDLSDKTLLTIINENAFEYSGLVSVDLPENGRLYMIEDYAFSGCRALQEIEIPASITVIRDGVFANARNLSKVTFAGNNITAIFDSAFAGTKALKSIDLPASLKIIGDNAFANGGLSGTFKISEGINSIGYGAFAGCYGITAFEVDENNMHFSAHQGVLYDKAQKVLYSYPAGKTDMSYTLLNTTEVIFTGAFKGNKNILYPHLPASLTTVMPEAFAGATNLRDLEIPDNVITIGRNAFSGCTSLRGISFGNDSKLSRIGYETFANCAISSFRVPANVDTIAQYAFRGCNSLTLITFASGSKLDNLPAYIFKGNENLTSIVFEPGSQLRSLSAHALEGMYNITTIDFSNTQLENIDNFAFRFCYKLKNITIPEGVTSIGRYAFYQCEMLADVRLPSTIDFIGRFAFLGAEDANLYFASEELPLNLQENWDHGIKGYYTGVLDVSENETWQYATLTKGGYAILDYFGRDSVIDLGNTDLDGDGVTDSIVNIGGYAFDRTYITNIVIPSSVTTIQRYAFERTELLQSITIPASVRFIGSHAFYGSGIDSIIFADGSQIENIEQYAFAACKDLIAVELPASLQKLGTAAFSESGLRVLTINEGLTEIPDRAFFKTSLVAIKLPESIEKIGYYAFAEIPTLMAVNLPTASELWIMGNAFANCILENVYIPANVAYLGEFCFTGNKNMQNYTADPANPYYTSENGILYSKDKSKLIAYPAGRTGSFEVPAFVEKIGFGAFEDSRLESVTFAEGINLLTIGNRAFYGSRINMIRIPSSVVSIDYYAFATCDELQTVIFETGCKLKGIYEGAFLNCRNLANITLPDSVVEISDFAFYGCESLTEIPVSENSSLKGIYDYAFAYTGISGDLILDGDIIDIGDYAFRGNDITSATIPDTNKEKLTLGFGIFHECNGMTSINLPFIGAVYDDTSAWLGYVFGAGAYEANPSYVPGSLKTVTVSEGLITVGEGTFYGLDCLERINLPESVEAFSKYAFEGCSAKYEIKEDIIFNYDNYGTQFSAVFVSKSVESVVIPDTFTSIGNYTFQDCKNLVSVTIPESVTSIGIGAFYGCSNLKEIVLPSKITSIPSSAFSGCSSLTSIVIPDGVLSIGEDAFTGCSKLESITIPNSVTNMGSALSSSVFIGCTSLKSVDLPDGLTSIGSYMFYMCKSLKNIDIPDSVTNIGFAAFQGCVGLDNLVLPAELVTIEHNAFKDCCFYSITLPAKLTSINSTAFQDTYALHVINNSSYNLSIGSGVAGKAYSYTDPAGNTEYKTGFENAVFGETEDGWKYVYNNNEYTLIGYFGGEESAVLPASINGSAYKVGLINSPRHIIIPGEIKELTNVLAKNAFINKVTLCEGVETIGNSAFYQCTALEEVNFSSTLTTIGENAFLECESIVSLNIPDNVKTIERGAFYLCKNLSNIRLPEGLTELSPYVFAHCYRLSQVEIPDSVESIGSGAFYLSGLRSIVIPKSVKIMEREIFSSCSSLQNVVFLNEPKELSQSMFYKCTSLIDITLPESLEVISSGAFSSCSKLKTVHLPESVTCIDGGAFNGCSSLEYLSIPEGVIKIGSGTFNGCTSLESVNIPSGIKTIEGYTFYGCSSLKALDIPDDVTEIGDYAFYGCSLLTSFDIPAGVTKIGAYAFNGCAMLNNIILPENITEIGSGTFVNCASIERISIPESVTSIAIDAFNGCTSLSAIDLEGNNSEYVNIGGIVYNKDITSIVAVPNGITSITVPATITSFTFKDLISLESVTFAEGFALTEIPAYAFSGCISLKSIVIPDCITSIGEYAFENCRSIANIQLHDNITTIGGYAFNGCTSLKSVSVPASVTSFGDGAFDNCSGLTSLTLCNVPERLILSGCVSLEQLTVPEGVKDVALIDCDSLTDLKLPGTLLELTLRDCDSIKDVNIPNGVTYLRLIRCNSIVRLTIPESATDFSVDSCEHLSKVELPENLEAIPKNAFFNCMGLSEIVIPDSVTSIGERAFYMCYGLTSITLPANLQSVGGYAFYYCEHLYRVINRTSMDVKSTGAGGYVRVVIDASGNPTYTAGYEGFEYIDTPDGWRFMYDNNYKRYQLLGYIGDSDTATLPLDYEGHEYSASSLYTLPKYLYIPEGFVLKEHQFQYSNGMKYVFLPEGIGEIPAYVFQSCTFLEYVYIPDSVTYINVYAFSGCHNLKTVPYVKESGVLSMEDRDNLEALDVPNGVEKLTLNGFKSLVDISIPISVTEISIQGLANIENIELPGNVKILMLANMPNLNEIYIPAGVEELTIIGLSGIDSLRIPGSVKRLTISGCSGITSLDIPSGVEYINISNMGSLKTLNIPKDTLEVELTGWAALEDINIPTSVISVKATGIEKTAYYNEPSNWSFGALYSGSWLLALDGSEGNHIRDYYNVIPGISSYTLKKIISHGKENIPGKYTNLETIVFIGDLTHDVFENNYPITLKNIVLTGGANALKDTSIFANRTDLRIFVNAPEEDCRWDENFPNWNNGNIVFYGGEWIDTVFTDNDGRVILDEYLSIFEVIKQPYMPRIKMIGNVAYKFIGWDVDGDGKTDPIPATSAASIYAVAVYEQYVHPSEEHIFADVTTVGATCYSSGYSMSTCVICGYFERFDYTRKLDHSYVASYVAPTCEGIGGIRRTCVNCGDFSYEIELPALGHEVAEWTVLKDGTCVTDGERIGFCTRCQTVVTEVIVANGHTFSLVNSTAATCTKNGQNAYLCDCGYLMTRLTAKLSHEYTRITATSDFVTWLNEQHGDIVYGIEGDKGYYYECSMCKGIMLSVQAPTESASGMASLYSVCLHDETTDTVIDQLTLTKCASCGETVRAVYSGVVTPPITLAVTAKGNISYTVSGNTVTVTHTLACKVGYLDGDKYVAVAATPNLDGSYSFTAPEGVTEVVIVIKGDVNGDGRIRTNDASMAKAIYLGKDSVTPTAEQIFAADANGDGRVRTNDASMIKSVYLGKKTFVW